MVEVMLLALVFLVGIGSVAAAAIVLGLRLLNKAGRKAED
jgi:hypothetical protein